MPNNMVNENKFIKMNQDDHIRSIFPCKYQKGKILQFDVKVNINILTINTFTKETMK